MADINEVISKKIRDNPVVLFMKGTKDSPQCGFSAQVVQTLNQLGVTFTDVNVLEDWDLREGLKAYSSWPTIPQLYVKGEFIGGCDITMEMHRKGELKNLFSDSAPA